MERKKSKVTGIIFEKSGTGKNGNAWFSFNVGFENGDSGKLFATSNPQTVFKVGEETEYIKDVTQNGQYTNISIKPINAQGGGGGKGFTQYSSVAANKRSALECAVSLAVAGKIELKDIGATAVKYNAWLGDEKAAKPEAKAPEQSPPPTQEDHVPDTTDSLPF